MRKPRFLLAAGLTLLLAFSFLLNPSAEKHRTAIKEATAERSPIAGALGIGAITAFASTYQSWGVLSYTTANDRVRSVGALGIIYVLQ
ncbi:MAG: hypothetical protein HYZ17_13840 [Betaproteobacteria bacterium]|nr:hypothetical protein [Betaproteobacteria bacterium]